MIRRDDVSLLLAIQQPAPNILASLRIYTYFFKSIHFIYKPDDRQLHYDFLKKWKTEKSVFESDSFSNDRRVRVH